MTNQLAKLLQASAGHFRSFGTRGSHRAHNVLLHGDHLSNAKTRDAMIIDDETSRTSCRTWGWPSVTAGTLEADHFRRFDDRHRGANLSTAV
jgi:hypothetical protein